MAESLEPCNSAAINPRQTKIQGRSAARGPRKNWTPPQRECPKCQAIWDFEMVKRSFLVILVQPIPAHHPCTDIRPAYPHRHGSQSAGSGSFSVTSASMSSIAGARSSIFNPSSCCQRHGDIRLRRSSSRGDDLFSAKAGQADGCAVAHAGRWSSHRERIEDLLGIDGGRKLTSLFCPTDSSSRRFSCPIRVTPYLRSRSSRSSLIRSVTSGECLAVEQFIGVHLAASASQPRALGVCIAPRHSTWQTLVACWSGQLVFFGKVRTMPL